jgi:hypothetical protein
MCARAKKAPFVPLLTVGDPNEAQITAARLRAAGIDVRMHGENFGPYPISLGELADTEIWVRADQVDKASAVITNTE